jgi:alkylhydroperoxidase family enzyme
MNAVGQDGIPDGKLSEIPADVAQVLAQRGAKQLNLYRALSFSPELVRAWMDFIWTLRDGCQTSRALRELVILRTAIRHESPYEWRHHVIMAEAAGVTADQIAELTNWTESAVFDGSERAALALTDAICDGTVTAADRASAASWFDECEIVEVVLTAAAYVMVPRVLAALGVPLETDLAVGESEV